MRQSIKALALLTGAKIRRERMSLNISQEFLAFQIGKTAQYISLLENGDRCGSVTTYLSIANELHLSLSGLFADLKVDTDNSVNEGSILELFYGCTPFEQRVMMAVLTAAKSALHSKL